MPDPKWLEWSQRIAAIAQSGLAYSTNPFDRERYEAIREVAAEILATYSETDLPVIHSILSAQTGYATPKVDIRGVVFQGDKILLVQELADGLWTLPGGWVDINEPPSHAVEREVREETGYEVKAVKLLAIYDRNLHGHPSYMFHVYKIYLLCDLIGGQPAGSIETGESAFYEENELPPLSLARTTPEVLSRLFEFHRHPDRPADFD